MEPATGAAVSEPLIKIMRGSETTPPEKKNNMKHKIIYAARIFSPVILSGVEGKGEPARLGNQTGYRFSGTEG
jgi:hypothetical protein